MKSKYYYDKENFKLILGDSLKELKKIEPKSIDMIFADPPYFLSGDGITCSGGKMKSVNKGDLKMGLINLDNGNVLYFAEGRFDKWCVYEKNSYGKRIIPRDVEYFTELLKLTNYFKRDDIYNDYISIYDLTTKNFDNNVVDVIKKISLKYGEFKSEVFRTFSILYMAMIAEENKANTKVGRRIKRLGVYYLLFKDKSPEFCANFMRKMPWQEIDKLCKEGGF